MSVRVSVCRLSHLSQFAGLPRSVQSISNASLFFSFFFFFIKEVQSELRFPEPSQQVFIEKRVGEVVLLASYRQCSEFSCRVRGLVFGVTGMTALRDVVKERERNGLGF